MARPSIPVATLRADNQVSGKDKTASARFPLREVDIDLEARAVPLCAVVSMRHE